MENFSQDQIDKISGIIEALLFVNEKPVTVEQIKKVLPTISVSEIKGMIQFVKNKYER